MWVKIIPLALVFGLISAQNPIAVNPAFDNYNDLFLRGAKTPGFWGAIGQQRSNVFDEKWNNGGYREIYNLNSNSPMAGNRGTGFDTTTTMFNQYGPTSFEVIPVQSNFMPQSRLNAYTYDLNEPRMAAIYKNYLRFMNKNLDRLGNVLKGNGEFTDLNNNASRKLKNPESFQYRTEYFDGLNLDNTIPEYYHTHLRAEPQKMRVTEERRLSQRLAQNRQLSNVDRIKALKLNLHHIEQKLNALEDAALAPQAEAARHINV